MGSRALRPTTKEAIVDAAIGALGHDRGASFDEIALRAGVGRATIYRHFPTREDLLTAITSQALDEMEAAVETAVGDAESAAETLLRMLEAIIPLGDRYHFLSMEPIEDDEMHQRYEEQNAWTTELVNELKAEGVVDENIPTGWVVVNIDAQIWLAWSEIASGHLAAAGAANLAYTTLLKGVGKNA